IAIEIEIDPCSAWQLAFSAPYSLAVEYCRHRNNTVGLSGNACPNRITRPFDSDTDPELALPSTFSGNL
ncbi:MAG: hypothetical protein QM518_07025, partial [Verrucomicrobiota bacterium]|nr:hypothetical protein [Verrucomicrobiota bacterium]